MDSRIRHQIGLELSNINVEGSIESKRSSQRRNNLSDQSVEISVSRTLDIEETSANVVDGLVIKHESDISMLKERVSRKDRVVGFDNSS